MRVYWSVNDIPEIAILPERDRPRVFELARITAWDRLGIAERALEVFIMLIVAGVVSSLVTWLSGITLLGCGLGAGAGTAVGNHRRFVRVWAELRDGPAA